MSIEDKARELGQAITEDERFKRYEAAKLVHDADTELGAMIERYSSVTNEYLLESDKEIKDEAKIENLSNAVRLLYDEIMKNPHMTELVAAKEAMEKLLAQVNGIIDFYVTGGQGSAHGCSSSSCATCGGCGGH